MNLKKTVQALAVSLGMLVAANANATLVSCGNPTLGVRLVAIDPGLVNGFCYAQNGNFNGDNFATSNITSAFGSNSLVLRGKEVADNGDVASANIDFTGSTSGSWTVASALWSSYDRLFLGFHFGGGDDKSATNPDSFIVELARAYTTGSWALTGNGAKLTGLSNIYVLSSGTCTQNCGGGINEIPKIPEPASLALVGLGLVGAALVRRRKA